MKIAVIDKINTFSPIFIEHWKKKHEVDVSASHAIISEYYDLAYFDWADGNCADYLDESNGYSKSVRVITRVRRYEAFSKGKMLRIDWNKVDEVIFNTKFLRDMCYRFYKVEKFLDAHIIPNGVDVDKWSFRERDADGKKVAMLAYWNPRKNVPMALQIFALLPEDYELHLAGKWFCPEDRLLVSDSSKKLGIESRVFITDDLVDTDKYLDDKDYLLQTSISEGVSNIVIEAMAKGIKPVIFNSLGQQGLYPDHCMFNHILGAKRIIREVNYTSSAYRDFVEKNYNRKEMLTKMDALL